MSDCGWQCTAASGAAWLGLARLGARNAGRKNLAPEEQAIYRAGLVRPKVVRTTVATLVLLPKIGVQVRRARDFGDVPITISRHSADCVVPLLNICEAGSRLATALQLSINDQAFCVHQRKAIALRKLCRAFTH